MTDAGERADAEASSGRWGELERVGLRRNSMAPVEDWFGFCASAGCVFELYARRYADNTEELRLYAFSELSEVVGAIRKHVGIRITEDEGATLKACLDIRNRLFHLELSKLTGKLRSLGEILDEARVFQISLSDESTKKVSQTSTSEGRIQGWLLQATTDQSFKRATLLFRRGIALLGWLRTKDCEG